MKGRGHGHQAPPVAAWSEATALGHASRRGSIARSLFVTLLIIYTNPDTACHSLCNSSLRSVVPLQGPPELPQPSKPVQSSLRSGTGLCILWYKGRVWTHTHYNARSTLTGDTFPLVFLTQGRRPQERLGYVCSFGGQKSMACSSPLTTAVDGFLRTSVPKTQEHRLQYVGLQSKSLQSGS